MGGADVAPRRPNGSVQGLTSEGGWVVRWYRPEMRGTCRDGSPADQMAESLSWEGLLGVQTLQILGDARSRSAGGAPRDEAHGCALSVGRAHWLNQGI